MSNIDNDLDDLLAMNPEEAAAQTASLNNINGNFHGAWTFSRYNEEKGSFSFGFWIAEQNKLVFQACGAPEITTQNNILNCASYWDAAKKESKCGNLLKFVTMLYVLGIMDKDGVAIPSFRKQKGVTVYLKCTTGKDGNQQVDISRPTGKVTAGYEDEKLRLTGLEEMQETFDKINDPVLVKIVELYEAEKIVVVPAREYLCKVLVSKYTKTEKSRTWFGIFETSAGKVRVGLNMAYPNDVRIFQGLVSILGKDFDSHKGMYIYALLGEDESKSTGKEFNTLESTRKCIEVTEEITSKGAAPEDTQSTESIPDEGPITSSPTAGEFD